MNIILFYAPEVELPLPRSDPRAVHLLDVLRRRPGDNFDAGLIDGPRGKGTLVAIDRETLTLSFVWTGPPPPLSPITLLIGLPRPQTARVILREMTALGVAALHFIRTEKGEASYARSTLWQSGEWKSHLIAGAAQAFCTRLPEMTHERSLVECLTVLPAAPARLALDNYESPAALSAFDPAGCKSAILAIGAERGWSAPERELLRQNGFAFVHLGPRVLRTETACLAAVTLLKAKLGLI
ncbi:MAG TPA: RsmE family RNA methyltransferase [Lacunisphaera sp.]|nr:RsmE family RNA methyltransferase [Lacunisphaera sp.]